MRDELLGMNPKDYDVATDAPPQEVGALFRTTREVGKAFGVMQVRISGVTVEVATFRREHGYTDRRRPDTVSFCDEFSDAARRDFTINALFVDPLSEERTPGAEHVRGRVIDHVDGLKDLRSRTIRAVGDPDARLAEDNLRALRAVRFAARLGFTIDPRTAEAIRRHASELAGVSRERIGEELRLMLSAPSRALAAALIQSLGLDAPVLEEPGNPGVAGGAVGSEAGLVSLGKLHDKAGFVLALGAWAIDRSASELDHQVVPAVVARWRRALCLSNAERDDLFALLETRCTLQSEWDFLPVAKQKRLAASGAFAGAIELLFSRSPEVARRVEQCVVLLAGTASGLAPEPWVTGDELIKSGLLPGPEFGKWLERAYDGQLEDRFASPAEALRAVLDWAKRERSGL